MKNFLPRLFVVILLAAVGGWLWSQRDRVASLSNLNVEIQGDWHKVEMHFSEPDTYTFGDNFISLDGREWATYKLLRGSRIEITTRGEVVTYELGFPDDENMVWSTRSGDTLVPVIRWRR